MNLGQLRQAVRDALDDNETPPLYADAELDRYLNNAVNEACLRARLLQDDSSEICRVALTAGQARYTLAPEILAVRAVHVAGRSEPLHRVSAAVLDRICPGWAHEEQTPAIPTYAVFDVGQKILTLHRPPLADGTAYLRVWRQPSEADWMEEDDDDPVIQIADPESLKHWALHEAYLKKDGELYDAEKSAAHLGLFEARFGKRPSEHDLTLWSTQPNTGPRRMPLDY